MAQLDDAINNDGSLRRMQRRESANATPAPGVDRNVGMNAIGGGQDNTFMSALQDRLIGQGGIVSSTDTDLESEINRAIESIGSSRESTAQVIESRFNSSIADATQTGVENATTQREGSGGFATQLAALRNITGQTDKRIGDLERQREEALLSNNAQAADRISGLIIKEKELEQQARQNMVSNLFQGAQLQQNQQQFISQQQLGYDRLFQQQSQFSEEQQRLENQTISELAIQYPNAPIKSGMDIEEVIQAVKPFAADDKKRQQEFEDLEMEIKQMRANAYAAELAGNPTTEGVQLGGQTISYTTASVINGLNPITNLTKTKQDEVNADLLKLGFASDTPPNWYVKQILPGDDVVPDDTNVSKVGESWKTNWNNYRRQSVFGRNFLTKNFYQSIYTPSQLQAAAEESGVDSVDSYLDHLESVNKAYRNAGISDQEQFEMMQ